MNHSDFDGAVKYLTTEISRKVSVIILSKNSAPTVEACLESVIRERPREIIAVDGQSTDTTISILKRYGVRIVVDTVRSLGYARQLGVEVASGDYVMFVDSDVVLHTGCIDKMVYELERHGWAGIHARLQSVENFSYWQRSQDQDFLRHYGTAGPIQRIDTIAALFRRDVLLKCPFDPWFRESAEDGDLSRRLTDANYMLGASSAVAYHLHRREFSAFVRQRFRNGLGVARIGMKYGDTRAFVDPMLGALSYLIRDVTRGDIRLVPYRLVHGPAVSLGVLVGFRKARPLRKERGEIGRFQAALKQKFKTKAHPS